nr:unnamed protein product [Callosobruchus analis]
MANRYVRSGFWLLAFSGLGYGMLVLTSPSQTYIDKLQQEYLDNESSKRNRQFMSVLQASTNSDQPLYRLSKAELDKVLKKDQ